MSELTWGDAVRVKAGAPTEHRPGASASVVRLRENPEEAAAWLIDLSRQLEGGLVAGGVSIRFSPKLATLAGSVSVRMLSVVPVATINSWLPS